MNKFNKSEFKWLLVLLSFTYYLYTLLVTGKIYIFINPKIIKYVCFSLILFVILSIIQLKRVFTIRKSKIRKINLWVFLFPLALGIFINPQELSSKTAVKSGISLVENNLSKQNTSTKSNISLKIEPNKAETQNTSTKSNVPLKIQPNKAETQNSEIVIDDSNFTHLVDDITYSDPNKDKGRTIKITGLVFRDDTTTKNEFFISRLMIVCCAADMEVEGILCDWSKTTTLKDDQWITVTGIIDTEMHKVYGSNQITPFIRIEKVVNAEKPKNPYVYPE
jgi:putative membrane protein